MQRVILVIIILSFFQCKKDHYLTPAKIDSPSINSLSFNKPLGAGIVLSVDDRNGPWSWSYIQKFLKDSGIKLTFYVNGFDKYDQKNIDIIKSLYLDGHEIAHHTRSHPCCGLYMQKYGMEAYIKNEITSIIDTMRRVGLNPVNFAYPYGAWLNWTDTILVKYFGSLRKTIFLADVKTKSDSGLIFLKENNQKIFYGCNIDNLDNEGMNRIFGLMRYAKETNQTISLYAHKLTKVSVQSEYFVYENDLKQIVLYAKQLGLKFYTVAEISRKSPLRYSPENISQTEVPK